MPKGKISRIKTRRTCTEYKRLFDCAKRKGLISLAPPPFNIPSYLSSTDFIAMKTSPGPLIAGSTRTNILKPNSYCYKGHYPQNQGEISNHFPRSLDWLRKYSGCGLRPSGSSSRFAPSPGKCIQPHCAQAPCPEICFDEQGKQYVKGRAQKKLMNREQVCIKTKPRMCKYLEDGSLGACSKDMVCSEYETAYRLGNLTIKEKLLIHIVVFAIVGAIIWNYNSKLVK